MRNIKKSSLILFLLPLFLIKPKYIKLYNQNRILDSHKEVDYIYIPKFNIKRVIINNTDSKTLDNYYVGKMNIKVNNLTILAGHNINQVFHKIHYLNIGDIAYINNIKYKVIGYKEIKVNDYSILNTKYDCPTIILMTCTTNKNKRYIVTLKDVKLCQIK